jgi:hypothetical protein
MGGSFSEALAATAPKTTLDAIREQLKPADRDAFDEALANPAYTPHRIALALEALGLDADRRRIGEWCRKARKASA